ncbi:MAG: trigger factor [Deltaproteobacteria bacterium]|nr:trigger factor [Deltaproteobacteria bacterium]MBW2053764.1 trigger factor [Deltaproteobacteria bacterium]MBW2142392.1 trigger factor [Deltaproteobacteria bacterium]MBW2322181.1 trigger factor [Deltaproteobacteria bacterium]
MDFNWEEIGPTKKKLVVETPAEIVSARMNENFRQVQKQAKFKGFRPGKAPLSMIKRIYGPQVEEEVTQKLINEALTEALEQADLNLAVPANLEESNYVEGEPYRFTLSLEIKPKFTIEGYDGLELTREPVEVTEEMTDKRLEQLREAYATTTSIEGERPLQTGDIAVIDYTAYVGEEALEGGENPSYQLEVGSGNFNPDFEAELVGLSKGENKEISVTFKENHYNPKLAGKDVRFEVKLLDIKEKVLPDLDDEFAKDLGAEFKTFDDLKEQIQSDLTRMEEQRVEELLRSQLRDKLLELVEFDIPESLVQQEVEAMVANTKFNFSRSGLSLETAGMSEEKLKEDYQPVAEKKVKTNLILEKIAKDKELTVTEDELKAKMFQIARETGQPIENIIEFYNQNNMLKSLSHQVLTEKTLNFLIENANIRDTQDSSESEAEGANSESSEESKG